MRRIVIIVSVVAVVAAACGGDGEGETTTTTATTAAPTTSAATTTTTAVATTTTAVTTTTTTAALAKPAFLWATNGSDGIVAKIDPASGDTAFTANTGERAAGVALGGGSAWVAVGSNNTLVRVDAETGEIVAEIAVGAGPADVAFTDGFAWVSNFDDGTVSQVDPATNAVVSTIEVGAGASGMTEGSAWVTTFFAMTLNRIAADGTVSSIDLPGAGSSPAVGGSLVAATLFDTGQLIIFPSESGEGEPQIHDTGNNANIVTFGFEHFWVTNSVSGEVWKVSPDAGTAEAVTAVPGALGIVAGEDMIYVASFPTGTVYQFPPDDPAVMNDLADIGESAFELAYGSGG